MPMNRRDATLGLAVEMDSTVRKRKRTHLTDLINAGRTNLFDTTCQSAVCRSAQMPERERTQTRNIVRDGDVATRAPSILVVHLKRFQMNWAVEDLRVEKVKKRIEYDEDMELDAFTQDGAPLYYKLYAVVAHAGESATSGHYISAVRHCDGQGDWSFVSDSDVHSYDTAAEMGDMALFKLGKTKFHPYLLFYQRVFE